jgi:hypothetical protein
VRIYVAVLYSGENEFESCIKAIEAQDYTNYEYHVIKGLPGREAHNTLYTNFIESGFDVLIKIDSDMVLVWHNFFTKVVDALIENMTTNQLQFPVYDFFSRQLIWGLNVYRKDFFNDISVGANEGRAFDYFDVSGLSCAVSVVVATHCQNPTPFQSFHYGAFKAVKIAQAIENGMDSKTKYLRNILNKTHQDFLKTGDERRAICITGARLAAAKKLGLEHLNYTNPYLLNCFNQIQDYQGKENLCL